MEVKNLDPRLLDLRRRSLQDQLDAYNIDIAKHQSRIAAIGLEIARREREDAAENRLLGKDNDN